MGAAVAHGSHVAVTAGAAGYPPSFAYVHCTSTSWSGETTADARLSDASMLPTALATIQPYVACEYR